MQELIDKADILLEALPYIRRFYQKTFVIKYGGNAMLGADLRRDFALDIILFNYIGLNPVIVHGGGPQIGEMLKKIGKESTFVEGMRVTDKETMDVVEMVLSGKVNKEIVSLINREGGKAVGLSGKDGHLITARKMEIVSQGEDSPPEIIDPGMVGEVEMVNPQVIESLSSNGFIPVIAPIGIGKDGETYNINADFVAGKIAGALKAEKLILLTDVEGVKDKNGHLISSMESGEVSRYLEDGVVVGGMLPKVKCCLDALNDGVKKTHIIDGRIRHAILLEMFTDVGIGTEIHK